MDVAQYDSIRECSNWKNTLCVKNSASEIDWLLFVMFINATHSASLCVVSDRQIRPSSSIWHQLNWNNIMPFIIHVLSFTLICLFLSLFVWLVTNATYNLSLVSLFCVRLTLKRVSASQTFFRTPTEQSHSGIWSSLAALPVAVQAEVRQSNTSLNSWSLFASSVSFQIKRSLIGSNGSVTLPP